MGWDDLSWSYIVPDRLRWSQIVADWPRWSQMVGDGGTWWTDSLIWSQNFRDGPKWSEISEMVPDGQRWSWMVKNGLRLFGMVTDCPRWDDPSWLDLVEDGLRWSSMVQDSLSTLWAHSGYTVLLCTFTAHWPMIDLEYCAFKAVRVPYFLWQPKILSNFLLKLLSEIQNIRNLFGSLFFSPSANDRIFQAVYNFACSMNIFGIWILRVKN